MISSSWAGGWHLRTSKQFADAIHPHAGSAVGAGTTSRHTMAANAGILTA